MSRSLFFPSSRSEAAAAEGSLRAGGTDLQERLHKGLVDGDVVDLRDVPGMDRIERGPWGLRIGAGVRLAQLANHPMVAAGYPGLAAAAGGLATPQIRAVATLGGNLQQEVRCWYYRNPAFHCLRRGGASCLAREGDHRYHNAFDRSPCVAPHASTMAMALLPYEALLEVHGAAPRPLAEALGSGRTVGVDLAEGGLIVAIHLPPPLIGEQSAYVRATARSRAEWPLVECTARLVQREGEIRLARVALGGVAPIPFRAERVEQALLGQAPDEKSLRRAAATARRGATPLPQTAYKIPLLTTTVLETLDRALQSPPVTPGAP